MNQRPIVAAILLTLALPAVAQHSRYSPVANPAADRSAVSGARVGDRRVMPSSRLTPIPTPDLQYGNRIVSGDVAGGKHFRGEVPYLSSSRFNSPLADTGSQAVTSFVRRSAGNPFSGGAAPYYDPRQTVTSLTRNGQSGLTTPQWVPQSTARDRALTMPNLPEGLRYSAEPISTASAEMERIINQQRGLREIALEYDMLRQRDETQPPADLESQYLTDPERQARLDASLLPPTPPEPAEPSTAEQERQAQVERMHRELLAALFDVDEEPLDDTGPQADTTFPADRRTRTDTTPESSTETDTERTPSGVEVSSDPIEARRRALAILGEHKDFESLAEAKFQGYFEQAEQYLHEGRFYKAADTYTLALVWRQQDPKAHFGRAVALFAAGSYLSSYYSAAAAIELDAALALGAHDIPALVGGRDTFENALIELERWQGRTGSAELAWLMAYMYHLDRRPDNARLALQLAADKLGETPVYKQLHQAVHGPAQTP
ncbi:MAG TPA: hypothetical protein ENN87_11740 [Phycisphaerales bacterium]|nr:hypothetical protein [Phycisphaerales bacterium]